MQRVEIDEIEHEDHPQEIAAVRRPVSAALGTMDVAINYFELEPGDSFSGGMHAHHDQEEVFYVLEGTATFTTEDGDVEVNPGEAIRFAPGEFQFGHNDGDGRVVAFAIGAPGAAHDWGQLESLFRCPECGERSRHDVALTADRVIVTTCRACGTELSFGG